MVSIAGPYRKGKSYILSEAFDQPNVFPLGHEMVAETMGIWLWIVPEKYKVSNNLAFYSKDTKPHEITLIPAFRTEINMNIALVTQCVWVRITLYG